jgi:type 1 fimbriae regulatory protein FimB
MVRSLSKDELQKLLEIAKSHNEGDYLMLLVMFNHGLRVSEVIGLTRDNVQGNLLVVQRLKGSEKTAQPLLTSEREALLGLAEHEGPFFPISRITAWRRMKQYCHEASIPEFKARPHALKHTTGKLGLRGGMTLPELQAYLGHKNGSNTMIYLKEDDATASKAFAAAVGA